MARHRPTSLLIALSIGFFVLNLGLALGQWDQRRVTFPADTGVAVSLEPGDERIVYMTADMSEGLSFDFYPSDFDCSATGPSGDAAVRLTDHRRLLDVWRRHWSIATVKADASGTYRVACSRHSDVPLLLASPAHFTVGWASPLFAVMLLLGVVIGSALIHSGRALVSSLLRHYRGG